MGWIRFNHHFRPLMENSRKSDVTIRNFATEIEIQTER